MGQTDEGATPQTEEQDAVVSTDAEPTVVDESEGLTRAEKAAQKHGLSVDEFKELRSTKGIAEKLEKLEKLDELTEALQPLVNQYKQNQLKTEFESMKLGEASFDEFQREYQSLLDIGADPSKAKDLTVNRLKEKHGIQDELERAKGRGNATLPPESSLPSMPATITKSQLSALPQDKYNVMRNAILQGKVLLKG